MPSTRPCAAFEPISPDFDLTALVESTPSFEFVTRIHCDMIEYHGIAAFERLVLTHVILGGKPLVIEGYDTKLDSWIFAIQWLRDNCGTNIVDARDLTKQENVALSIGHYLKHMPLLTNQWDASNYKDPERQRMYLKDIDCPQIWQERISQHVPAVLWYLNESTGDLGGMGAQDEPDPSGAGMRRGRGIAKAGDLMSSLPKEMRAENLMCYIGHEGTYTPSHREMCASLGHNIMVEASSGDVEDGQKTRPGSSIWFMTESKEREIVSEYWLSRLGHDIEVEKHFAQINAWKNAPFKTYIVDQKPGDFILIPPLAPHQVWNRGTRTMKIAWNRTTVETLEMAMNEALFKARMVCRDEQYKNKAIIYFTLDRYAKLLEQANRHKQKNPNSRRVQKAELQVKQLQKDFKRLHVLFTRMLVDESFYSDRAEKKVELIPFEGNVTCSYCRCNIFNRFLTCTSCVGQLPDGDEDTYDACLDCYAMGRSCACISKLKWVEQWAWGDLVQKHEQWRLAIVINEGGMNDKTPKSLRHEIDRRGKKRTIAQICQTELLKRPFRDIRKTLAAVTETADQEEEVVVGDNGNVKRKKIKKKSEKFIRDHGRCHVDCYWEPRWKQAQCTKCQKNYCYGILFRAYDMMPQDVLANPEWTCPACLNICNCRHCSKKPGWKRYTPKGTLLGHNTKAVADARSVESLVDFSFSNIQWIKKADDDYAAEDTRRMQQKRRDANAAMNQGPELGDHYVYEGNQHDVEGSILRLAEQEGIPIDPALGAGWTAVNAANHNDTPSEDEVNENPEEVAKRSQAELEEAQFLLPDGGVVQDLHHAYDPTDMITFTYPDPAMGQVPPAPVEGYQEAAEELPYHDADPPSPGEIEMVERKRKRKLDDGDKAFYLTNNGKAKKVKTSKKRQSLVVRLAISREKLQELDKMASIARSALNGVVVPAPVLGSDLQALNVHPSEDAAQSAKKTRREDRPPPIEVDDEYAPSRSRDRRKLPVDGTPLLPKDPTTSERRTTRMHNVTYAEPDEEEFSETVAAKSKLATMEAADVLDSIEPVENGSVASEEDEPAPTAKVIGKRPALTTPFTAVAATDSRPSTASSTTRPVAISNTALTAQARANQRAKLAALEDDIDDVDDDWSADDSEVNLAGVGNTSRQQVVRPASKSATPRPMSAKFSSSGPASPNKSRTTFTSKVLIGAMRTPSAIMGPASKVSNARMVSAQKASAGDWADSDSD